MRLVKDLDVFCRERAFWEYIVWNNFTGKMGPFCWVSCAPGGRGLVGFGH